MIRILLNKFTAFIGLILFLLVGNNGWGQYTGTVTISSTGNATYTVPAGVTCLTVQIWGAGGAGGSRTEAEDGAGGGGGGGYTFAIVPVNPGDVINLYVGQGGQPVAGNNNGGNGESSWFLGSGNYFATGGSGGTWGDLTVQGIGGAGGTGTYSGGNGGDGRNNGSGTGGGGGGAAGTTAAGSNGGNGGAAPGTAGASPLTNPQGDGGAGGGANGNGVTGQNPGGGGGGAGSDEGAGDRLGGTGGNGQIIVTPNALNICANYCSNTVTGNTYPISNVTFNTINNTTSAAINGTPGVQDFTSTCTSVTQGVTYNLSVTATGSAGSPFYLSAYFDWNLDGDFNDANESNALLTAYTTATGNATIPITIPCDAIAGRSIQMRIINRFSSVDPCASSANGQIEYYCITIVAATPPVANAGPDQNINCSSNATLNATASTPAASGFWTLVNGTGDITNTTDPNTTVTGLSNGANEFQWTQVGTCANSTDNVIINVSGLPDVPVTAGDDIFTCTQGEALDGSDPSPFTGQWVVVSGPNTPTFTPGNTTNNATVSGMINGTYVLEWQVNAGGCGIISDQMTFTFGSLPAPNAGPDQTICPTGTTLNGNDFLGATGTWSVFSGPAGAGFVDVNDPNSMIYGLVAGSYVIHWSVSGGGCPGGTFDAMTITVNACTTAVSHSATGDQTFTGCQYTYTDNGGSGGNYSNGIAQTWTTFCPDDPNDFATLTVSAANFFVGDYITIYDSPGPGSPIIASYWYDPSPGGGMVYNPPLGTTITSSTGCLYVQMNSTASNNTSGWTSTVGCSSTAGVQSQQFISVNNCGGGGGITLCGNGSILADAGGVTNPPDLGGANSGCLGSQEGASNTWVYITAESDGYIAFEISPAGGQDFDYAIWGPYDGGFACPGSTLDDPIRCSWATNGGAGCPADIGLGVIDATGGSVLPGDVSEGAPCTATNEGWTYPILATAGEVYVLLFQNYGFNSSSFDVTINSDPSKIPAGGSYAALGCDPPQALPVELLSFVGEHRDRVNKLFWNCSSESNNDYFTIERSTDGENWTLLTTVDGAGYSQSLTHYSTIDPYPVMGVNYYRLSQTDFDGTKRKYKTIALSTELVIENMFSDVYPNPTQNSFYFNYGGKDFESPINVQVFNASGQLVINEVIDTFNSSQSMEIETIDLTTGMYYVSITQNDKREMKKISIIK